MKVESIAECSLGAFYNTFDLQLVLKTNFGLLFEWPVKTGSTVDTKVMLIIITKEF